ncbi:MAG: 50S ribosomal protein L10 [bacterium]|nr:50S ribosomal protein L10 [bacterium]
MKKAEKTFFVENLTEELKSAKSFVLVNFSGLSVKLQQELKSKLKKAGAKMLVVKNTLLKRAGEKAKIDAEILSDSVLFGQTALIISNDDPVSYIQVLGNFAKENEVPTFKVGIVEGVFQNPETLEKLSTLPGRDVLLGQLLGALTSPIQNLIGTLQNPVQKLIYTVNSKLT